MAIIRAKQGVITRVLPHQGNRRYLIPGGMRGYPLGVAAEVDLLGPVQALFGVGDEGVIYDLADESTLFTDQSRTTAATLGDSVAGVADLSGNDNHAINATGSGTPEHRGWPKTVGTDLVTNGLFAADTDWTKGTGWTITGGAAVKTAGTASNLTQAISLVAGTTYLINVLFERTAGSFNIDFTGGTTVTWDVSTTEGGLFNLRTAVTGNTTLSITADSAFAGNIKEITVEPVTAFRNLGLDFDMAKFDRMWCTGIDISATKTCTMGFSNELRPNSGNSYIASFQQSGATAIYYGNVTNPTWGIGDSATDVADLATTEVVSPRFVNIFQGNTAGATAADRNLPKPFGVDKTAESVYTGAGCAGVNWGSNGTMTFGGYINNNTHPSGIIDKVFFINRLLDATELATLEAWLKDGKIYCAFLGDSVTDEIGSADGAGTDQQTSIGGLCGNVIYTSGRICNFGDRMADQTTLWNAMPAEDQANLDAVVIGGFHNDVKGRIGEGTATITNIMTELQTLVDLIAADTSASCKIYVMGLIPCKEWLDTASQPADAYQAWQDYNTQISTVLTGVDAVIKDFSTGVLNDGSGNLVAEYQAYADGVHQTTRARFLMAREVEAQIDLDFF